MSPFTVEQSHDGLEYCCDEMFRFVLDNEVPGFLELVDSLTCTGCGQAWIVNRRPADEPDEWSPDEGV